MREIEAILAYKQVFGGTTITIMYQDLDNVNIATLSGGILGNDRIAAMACIYFQMRSMGFSATFIENTIITAANAAGIHGTIMLSQPDPSLCKKLTGEVQGLDWSKVNSSRSSAALS